MAVNSVLKNLQCNKGSVKNSKIQKFGLMKSRGRFPKWNFPRDFINFLRKWIFYKRSFLQPLHFLLPVPTCCPSVHIVSLWMVILKQMCISHIKYENSRKPSKYDDLWLFRLFRTGSALGWVHFVSLWDGALRPIPFLCADRDLLNQLFLSCRSR